MIRAALILAFVGSVVSAQTLTDRPQFEVASVKPNVRNPAGQTGRAFKGAVNLTNMPLRLIIANAYTLRLANVLGGPEWIDTERFDIDARAPEGASDDQLNLMLRSLLSERFRLLTHTERREQPIYALVLARSDSRLGPNLQPSTECMKGASLAGMPAPSEKQYPCGVRMSASPTTVTLRGGAAPINSLARALDGTGGRQVVDRTGLTGTFNFDFRYAHSNLQTGATGDNDLPTVFTALQEQLGLKLEPVRGPVEVLVIDSVERPSPD